MFFLVWGICDNFLAGCCLGRHQGQVFLIHESLDSAGYLGNVHFNARLGLLKAVDTCAKLQGVRTVRPCATCPWSSPLHQLFECDITLELFRHGGNAGFCPLCSDGDRVRYPEAWLRVRREALSFSLAGNRLPSAP